MLVKTSRKRRLKSSEYLEINRYYLFGILIKKEIIIKEKNLCNNENTDIQINHNKKY